MPSDSKNNKMIDFSHEIFGGENLSLSNLFRNHFSEAPSVNIWAVASLSCAECVSNINGGLNLCSFSVQPFALKIHECILI